MSEINAVITRLEIFPNELRKTVEKLSKDELQQKVVNWTIAQNVHHIADSHLNSYIRIKLALTEKNPTIKPYNESIWATLTDNNTSIDNSLAIVEGIHNRICFILRNLTEDEWQKTFVHPELNPSQLSILEYTHRFADHGEHHLEGIKRSLSKND